MPNHVRNNVTITFATKEDLTRFKETVISQCTDYYGFEKETIDFEKIIPMPETVSRDGISAKDDWNSDTNWYGWSIHHWGTKWNAYDFEWSEDGNDDTHLVFSFNTAWNTCRPIFIKLGEMFQTAVIHVDYADEDIGYNCGQLDIKDGTVDYKDTDRSYHAYKGETDKPLLFAIGVWGCTPEEYGYVYDKKTGMYVYDE